MDLGPEYYDQVYSESKQYRGPPEDSVYYPVWRTVLKLIHGKSRILDLGCGPGQFAELCIKARHTYTGLDWSQEAINLARAKKLSSAQFILVDVEKDPSLINTLNYDVATFIEFLEHVKKDLEILSHVPRGRKVILTVPSYGGIEHFRHFQNLNHAIRRYRPHINIQIRARFPSLNLQGDTIYIYLLAGQKT